MEHEHATSARTYRKILAALMALTVLTVLAASVNFGAANAVIALAIATVKASLVALFFMHLRHDKPMNAVIFTAGLAILATFLMFAYLDEGARASQGTAQRHFLGMTQR